MSSQISRLKAQLEAKNKANESSQYDLMHNHLSDARSQAEKERIQIETAKKLAARFNLTHRALALSGAKKAQDQRLRDMEAAKAAKEAAHRYQMTARSLQMSSTGTATGKVNVLNHSDSSYTAPPLLDDEDLLDDDYSSAAKFTDLSSFMSSDDLDLSLKQEEDSAVGDANAMDGAVRSFFEAHDTSRIGETAALLQEYAGREDELMVELNRQYPHEGDEVAEMEKLSVKDQAE